MEGIDKGDDGGSGWRLMMAGPLPLPVVCWRHTALPARTPTRKGTLPDCYPELLIG